LAKIHNHNPADYENKNEKIHSCMGLRFETYNIMLYNIHNTQIHAASGIKYYKYYKNYVCISFKKTEKVYIAIIKCI
jgi:hypothetical protein